jgi:hypothetical protein
MTHTDVNLTQGRLPSRAGFVVIDGIVDPVNWSSESFMLASYYRSEVLAEPSHKWPINWLASTEKTYRFYLETCSRVSTLIVVSQALIAMYRLDLTHVP